MIGLEGKNLTEARDAELPRHNAIRQHKAHWIPGFVDKLAVMVASSETQTNLLPRRSHLHGSPAVMNLGISGDF